MENTNFEYRCPDCNRSATVWTIKGEKYTVTPACPKTKCIVCGKTEKEIFDETWKDFSFAEKNLIKIANCDPQYRYTVVKIVSAVIAKYGHDFVEGGYDRIDGQLTAVEFLKKEFPDEYALYVKERGEYNEKSHREAWGV